MSQRALGKVVCIALGVGFMGLMVVGCRSACDHRRNADRTAGAIIDQKQEQALGRTEPLTIETPEQTLRRRLLLDQDLPYSSPASLGARDLEPIDHWPKDDYLDRPDHPETVGVEPVGEVLHLSLIDALQIGARSSRDYQTRKEAVFIEALGLDLERNAFRPIFSGTLEGRAIADLVGDETAAGVVGTGSFGVNQAFKTGAQLSSRIMVDLVRLLTMDRASSFGIAADATVSVPLLRGAGRHIVTEPLTQAERDVIYAMFDFESFKRSFAVSIASNYLGVLQQLDQVRNAEENYQRLIQSTRRARRLADAGRVPELQVDQSIQQELSASNRWIAARESYGRQLDAFKMQLGLPPDARIELDHGELQRLTAVAAPLLEPAPEVEVMPEERPLVEPRQPDEPDFEQPPDEPLPRVDEPVELREPTLEEGGPYEIEDWRAIQLALEYRLDLRIAQGEVFDAQRRVVVAADALRAGLTLTGTAAAGGRRASLAAAGQPDARLRPERGVYTGGLLLDLPLERTAQRNAYRISLISLERATRSLQALEDSIKLDARNGLRNLLQAREALQIQAEAVRVAERRVARDNLLLEAGRAEIRDVLEAEESLITAQNALTAAVVNYRIGELQLQRDLGLLEVDYEGLWREYDPEELSP